MGMSFEHVDATVAFYPQHNYVSFMCKTYFGNISICAWLSGNSQKTGEHQIWKIHPQQRGDLKCNHRHHYSEAS